MRRKGGCCSGQATLAEDALQASSIATSTPWPTLAPNRPNVGPHHEEMNMVTRKTLLISLVGFMFERPTRLCC